MREGIIEEKQIAIQLTGIKKQYRLGTINGGTLKADIQSRWVKVRGNEFEIKVEEIPVWDTNAHGYMKLPEIRRKLESGEG